MILHCDKSLNMFPQEFELNSELRKLFNKEYQDIKQKINKINYKNFLLNEELKVNVEKYLEKSQLVRFNYITVLIHMSMNRHFNENQRFNEFKSYYLTKKYLNQLKFTNN